VPTDRGSPDDAMAVTVTAPEEHAVIVRALSGLGVPEQDARIQADWLVEADLRGYHSHGIQRLPVLMARLRRGLIAAAPAPVLTWRAGSVLAVDGQRGLGPVVACRALDAAALRLPAAGIVLVAIANSNHLGLLAPYVERIAAGRMIGIAMTTSEALVHPWGGRQAMIGTNPIAIGVPAGPSSLVLDMATGEVSMGQILNHLARGAPLRPGWAVDQAGYPTTDPRAATEGAISPFGGPKGYGLGLAIEVLVAALTGTSLGSDVRGTLDADHECTKGDVFICIDPERAVGPVAGDEPGGSGRLAGYLSAVRASPPAPGSAGVRLPGERAAAERAERTERGIVLTARAWQAALDLSAEGISSRRSSHSPRNSAAAPISQDHLNGQDDTMTQCSSEQN
jgi:L-2-hydroxycarboxylate dehydrogenase (NAD+)